ncbi:MAG: hypothetical protein V5A64_00575 [Candidatus Thermoplasmatota archaeon]
MMQKKFDWGTFIADLYVPFRYWKLKLITFLVVLGLVFLLNFTELHFHFNIPYISYLLVLIGFSILIIGVFIDKKRENTLYFDSENTETLPEDWDSYQKIRMRKLGKAWAKSIVTLIISGIIVYVFMERIFQIKNYGQTEVLIAVGIPLAAWWSVLAISLWAIHRDDKKWFEKLQPEKKERINKWKKILNLIAVIFLIFVLFQMLITFDIIKIPIEYHFYLWIPMMLLLIPAFYIVIKFQKDLKK